MDCGTVGSCCEDSIGCGGWISSANGELDILEEGVTVAVKSTSLAVGLAVCDGIRCEGESVLEGEELKLKLELIPRVPLSLTLGVRLPLMVGEGDSLILDARVLLMVAVTLIVGVSLMVAVILIVGE